MDGKHGVDGGSGFLSTPSGWRATGCAAARTKNQKNFYPRPPGGGRPSERGDVPCESDFYPRPPGGGRRFGDPCTQKRTKFLSTPSGWRATTFRATQGPRTPISIHALRVEGDMSTLRRTHTRAWISIHALRVEGDSMSPSTTGIVPGFLSTPSGWRATRR